MERQFLADARIDGDRLSSGEGVVDGPLPLAGDPPAESDPDSHRSVPSSPLYSTTVRPFSV
jgi:hypothetical protein